MASAVAAPFNTNPAYSGSFIPQLWTKKLNAKYYVDNQLAEIVNTNWEGEIKNQGDSVRIRTAPTLSINDYSIGGTLAGGIMGGPIGAGIGGSLFGTAGSQAQVQPSYPSWPAAYSYNR